VGVFLYILHAEVFKLRRGKSQLEILLGNSPCDEGGAQGVPDGSDPELETIPDDVPGDSEGDSLRHWIKIGEESNSLVVGQGRPSNSRLPMTWGTHVGGIGAGRGFDKVTPVR